MWCEGQFFPIVQPASYEARWFFVALAWHLVASQLFVLDPPWLGWVPPLGFGPLLVGWCVVLFVFSVAAGDEETFFKVKLLLETLYWLKTATLGYLVSRKILVCLSLFFCTNNPLSLPTTCVTKRDFGCERWQSPAKMKNKVCMSYVDFYIIYFHMMKKKWNWTETRDQGLH